MCVLIVKPANKKAPTSEILRQCCKANPHGFGFVTPSRIFKTLNEFEFTNEVKKINPAEPALIHCRYATHGSVKVENCHPFLNGDWAFAHNGILSNIKPANDLTDSETAFVQIFSPLLQKNGMTANVKATIDGIRGGYSKFAFLNVTTLKVYIFGEFQKSNGCLFSNMRWQTRTNFGYFGQLNNYRNQKFYDNVFSDLPF